MKPVAIRLALLWAAMLPATAGEAGLSARLAGSWLCESGCWDEEVEFAVVDGEQVYNSWLHDRPSASGGRWSVAGDVLTIRCCAGPDAEYVVVRVTDRELLLRDTFSGEETLLKRFVAEPPP